MRFNHIQIVCHDLCGFYIQPTTKVCKHLSFPTVRRHGSIHRVVVEHLCNNVISEKYISFVDFYYYLCFTPLKCKYVYYESIMKGRCDNRTGFYC